MLTRNQVNIAAGPSEMEAGKLRSIWLVWARRDSDLDHELNPEMSE